MATILDSGKQGEWEATKYLKSLGYKILQTNFRSKTGEIDIISEDGKTIVFVEVKLRTTPFFGTPGEAIQKSKLKKLIKTSQFYLLLKNLSHADIRFDAIEIYFLAGRFEINHIRNITQ